MLKTHISRVCQFIEKILSPLDLKEMDLTMEKTIYNILNYDTKKLVKECKKLDETNYYWKLITFDSHVENLHFMDFNEAFGRYQIWGIGDFKHAFVIDRGILKKGCVNVNEKVYQMTF